MPSFKMIPWPSLNNKLFFIANCSTAILSLMDFEQTYAKQILFLAVQSLYSVHSDTFLVLSVLIKFLYSFGMSVRLVQYPFWTKYSK
jgi:hypothetical protein